MPSWSKILSDGLKEAVAVSARLLDWWKPQTQRSTGSIREQAIYVLTRGHTGRKVKIDTDSDAYKLAVDWSCRSPRKMRRHRGAKKFRNSLSVVAVVPDPTFECFRGRTPKKNGELPSSGQEMGPPPKEKACSDRYNRAGVPVLYLCDSPEAVELEIERRFKEDDECFALQEYTLPTSKLRIADLSVRNANEFIICVMDIAESIRVGGRGGPPDFEFSQFVAELVASAGFDGMICPGVRGDRGTPYHNIVIFKPEERWREWFRGETGFSHRRRAVCP